METHTDIIQENESKIIKVDKEIMTEKKTYKEIEIETDFCMNVPSKNLRSIETQTDRCSETGSEAKIEIEKWEDIQAGLEQSVRDLKDKLATAEEELEKLRAVVKDKEDRDKRLELQLAAINKKWQGTIGQLQAPMGLGYVLEPKLMGKCYWGPN